MTMKMPMAEFVGLELCPFCKGEAFYNPEYNGGCVECRECGAEGPYKRTEAEAIAAWNTRVERTCENTDKYHDYRFKCSECNCVLYYEDLDGEPWVFVDGVASVPNYCPNCGARRVGE
jgi:Lar family restriction alleviation protein